MNEVSTSRASEIASRLAASSTGPEQYLPASVVTWGKKVTSRLFFCFFPLISRPPPQPCFSMNPCCLFLLVSAACTPQRTTTTEILRLRLHTSVALLYFLCSSSIFSFPLFSFFPPFLQTMRGMTDTWERWGSSPEGGWRRRAHAAGTWALERIHPEETTLSELPAVASSVEVAYPVWGICTSIYFFCQ